MAEHTRDLSASDDHELGAEIAGQESRTAWLELFYDLVFAAAVITFSDAVSHHPEPQVIGVVTAAFAAVWLVWLATTVYVNQFGIDDTLHRVLVVVQMLLLTLTSLAIGDGINRNPELASVAFALLALDVAIMYGRHARKDSRARPLAMLRRNQYAVAALPALVAAFLDLPWRGFAWALAVLLMAIPALGIRGGSARTIVLDEHHLCERLGLLTIIVIGEAFVKVSLVVTDGHLDGIDVTVLVAVFVVMFGIWWSYFDDIPDAGIGDGALRSIGWLVGHLAFQIFLVGVAVAYAKWLQFDSEHIFTGERSLLGAAPVVGYLVALALIGVCTRRVPRAPLCTLRLGTAAVVLGVGLVNWLVTESAVEAAAGLLATVALVQAALAARLRRATELSVAAEVAADAAVERGERGA